MKDCYTLLLLMVFAQLSVPSAVLAGNRCMAAFIWLIGGAPGRVAGLQSLLSQGLSLSAHTVERPSQTHSELT